MSFTSSIRIERDQLLTSGFDWSASRRTDLGTLPAQFDVAPLAEDYLRCLRALLLDIVGQFHQELSDCRDYLQSARRVLRVPAGGWVFLFDNPPQPDLPEASSPPGLLRARGEIVPEEQFEWLLRQISAMARTTVDFDAAEAAGRSLSDDGADAHGQ